MSAIFNKSFFIFVFFIQVHFVVVGFFRYSLTTIVFYCLLLVFVLFAVRVLCCCSLDENKSEKSNKKIKNKTIGKQQQRKLQELCLLQT
jgi:hypothetical protein